MRYLIWTFCLIWIGLHPGPGFAQASPDCSKITNAEKRVNCQVEERIVKTKRPGAKKAKASKEKNRSAPDMD
jgi:hypothetical protein